MIPMYWFESHAEAVMTAGEFSSLETTAHRQNFVDNDCWYIIWGSHYENFYVFGCVIKSIFWMIFFVKVI